ncbi:MAG: zinc-ribbon domain-containing protein [Clostridia bacterium]|nr:zinc-ribbon domain-containing protein [Clostridia bacterium]NLS84994.1 zinc-ribbon domain-containing protein [Oscillospiraceae bacterium]
MALWTGCTCSSCNKPFDDGDDVVVCPQCGSPYHRECYEKAGKCVFTDKHGNGFEYKRPEQDIKKRCGNCGAENDSDATVCHKCGAALEQPESTVDSASTATEPPKPRYEPVGGFQQGSAAAFVLDVPKEIDGIPAGEWAKYIGNSAPYYLLQFKQMDITHRKTGFCWSALIFPPMYFLYRRMWVEGILTAVLFMLLSVPSMLYTLLTVGISLPAVTLSLATLDNLSLICNIVSWLLQVVCGLFAFYLFRKSAVKKLTALKAAAATEDDYKNILERKSGPSKVAVLLLFIGIMALSMLLAAWIGPSRLAALYYY